MKNISVLLAFTSFAVVAMISSVTALAPVGPGASVEFITSSIIIPVAQDLPVDRHRSQA
jgi:hypothetical protein